MELSHTETKDKIHSLLDQAYELRIKNLEKSMSLAEEALDLAKKIEDEPCIAKALSFLALFHMIIGDFDLSINIASEALDYFEKLEDEKGIANAKYTIAGAYYKRDDYYKGLNYLLECIPTYKKFGDYHNLSRVQKSLGTIYEYLGDIESATKIYLEAVDSGEKANDPNLQSNAFNPLSGIYLNQGQVKKALEIIEKSIELKEQTGDIRGLAFALYGRGKVYTEIDRFEQAEKDLLRSIKIHEEMGEILGWAMSHHKLGALYLKMGKLEKAKETLITALEYSNKNKIILIKFKSNLLLHEIAKKEGDFELALKYLSQYIEEKESVINSQTADVIEGYTAIGKMKELEYEANVQKEKADLIEKKNIELDSFFYRISHDLKGPTTSMSSLAYIVKHEITDEKSLTYFREFESQATRLSNILNELLKLTRISYDSDKKEKIDFTQIVSDCISSYKYLENFDKISFELDIKDVSYKAEWSLINSILQNLIENGIKYARTENNEPSISVRIHPLKSEVVIAVEDNGIGMTEEDVDKIFKMFFRANRTIEGTGLGLHILKRAVDRLKGKVEVASKIGEGTTFTVWLPK